MAYVIKLVKHDMPAEEIADALRARIEGGYRAKVTTKEGRTPRVEIRDVRLLEAKPYCGQHAGPCQTGKKLRRSTCLEGDDWIAFHGEVNDLLDDLGVQADAWTERADTIDRSRRLYVRRADLGRRVRWDYDQIEGTQPNMFGIVHYGWNSGTPDQFASVNEDEGGLPVEKGRN